MYLKTLLTAAAVAFALPALAHDGVHISDAYARVSGPAAKSGAILRMDGMLLLGFGPRTPEAAQQLHDALYGAAP